MWFLWYLHFIPFRRIDKLSTSVSQTNSFQSVNITLSRRYVEIRLWCHFKAKDVVFKTKYNTNILKFPKCDSFWSDGSHFIFKYTILLRKQCWINRYITWYNILNPTLNLGGGKHPIPLGSWFRKKLGSLKVNVKLLKIVDDCAECGVALIQSYNYLSHRNDTRCSLSPVTGVSIVTHW